MLLGETHCHLFFLNLYEFLRNNKKKPSMDYLGGRQRHIVSRRLLLVVVEKAGVALLNPGGSNGAGRHAIIHQ